MTGMQCSMIKDLDDNTEMWRIVVRVLRRWNSYHKDSPTQLYAICFLLMDKQGDKIQASVMNKSLFKKYEKHPVEGQCYFIANLEVIPNGKDYKEANHQFKLLFNSATYVQEESAEIPLSVFNFFPIRTILTQTLENHTMFLFDVIAFVITIDPLEEYYSGADKKSKLRLVLADERGNTVPMVLYDDCASTFAAHEFPTTQKPTVLLAQTCKNRCGTKSQVTNGVASCGNNYCKGKKCTIQPKLRLNYLIADESGTASIVLFDKHATELLKKTASQLKAEIPKNQIRFAFPKEVDNLLGKKMILKMKLNSFNKNHPNSSVSVATYAEATDLSDAFDAAATRTAEDKGPSTAKPDVTQSESLTTIDLDDISSPMTSMLLHQRGKGRSKEVPSPVMHLLHQFLHLR
ncbi:hypothetical protein K1719_006092 [Acacia pycnantha]|nr:hypothetical protein K1719_006092 [Acacia pycnantha]